MHMFQSNKTKKKKEKLWSACQTLHNNVNQDSSIMPSVQPQQPHHQRLHHLQQHEAMFDVEEQQDDIAPPPYSQMNCNGSNTVPICYASYHNPMDTETSSERMSIEQDYETKIGGYCCESYCESASDDCSHHYCNRVMAAGPINDTQLLTSERLRSKQLLLSSTNNNHNNNNNNSTAVTTMGNALTRYWNAGSDSVSSESSIAKRPHPQNYSPMMKPTQGSASTTPTTMKTATATTPSVFRNCCFGRGSESSESSIGTCTHPQRNQTTCTLNNNAIGINNNNYNTTKNNFNIFEQKPTTTTTTASLLTTTNDIIGSAKDHFKALMKRLKEPQLETLYQVVATRPGINDTNRAAQQNAAHQFSDCILVQREMIKGKEPNVIACLLWLWPDLKTSAELKRVPMCPNGKEKVYVCCNPAHWNRIVIPEAVPPPYQESVMDRLRPEDRAPSENLKDAGFSSTSGLRVQIPESFTTNGEAHSPSRKWCEILYFELAERFGNKYVAENSIVNVYSEGSGGMCLKNCFGATNRKSVEKVRQKIGLGITLSQEADGVWLYNRSEAPIFIHSPTLNEDYRHVTKVPPGYCLNAFDNNRARTQNRVYPPQIAGAQTGPIDVFSMKISFAKGWGSKYRRQDITACQCWLDVIFFLPR